MNLQGAVTVVTGGARGIGRALAERFAAEGAAGVVVADLDRAGAEAVAAGLGCPTALGVGLDVTDPAAVAGLVGRVEEELGPVDLWCSNAGVALGLDLGDGGDWERSFAVHVLAHVHVARELLPRMAARGRGQLLLTASAAGLLTNMDSAPYSVTKHGTVALAEWLAIRWGDAGVAVSCLCPQGVRTAMTEGMGAGSSVLAAGALLEPEQVADAVVAGLADGRFLILPHPEVAEFERRRAADRDRWLAGMRRARARLRPSAAEPPGRSRRTER
jgi:NAD(P)-dependent dehydrogenase (short-subunit alcohol dehydrogenase family)